MTDLMELASRVEAGEGKRIAAAIAAMSGIERKAVRGSIFLAGDWVLTTQYENRPEIMEDLSEDIADCVSGILTPFGEKVRLALVEVEARAHQGAAHVEQ